MSIRGKKHPNTFEVPYTIFKFVLIESLGVYLESFAHISKEVLPFTVRYKCKPVKGIKILIIMMINIKKSGYPY